MRKAEREQIVTLAKEQFAFLKAEQGFTRPLLNRPTAALLTYRNATMGIRIEMSMASNDMEIMVGKLGDDGRFPFANHGRERMLWLLESLLTRQLQVQDQHILALDQIRLDTLKMKKDWECEQEYEWDIQRWEQVISLYQALLRDHIDLIVRQPSEVLFPSAIEYLAMGSTCGEWAQLARAHFAFLGEHGFRPDPVYALAGRVFDTYTWISADRGIQLTIDHRELYFFCDLISLIDGKIPATHKMVLQQDDDIIQGEGVKISLRDLLSTQLGITDPEIERIGNLHNILNIRHWTDCDYRYVSTFIIQSASLVRRYIQVLMDTPLEVVFASAHPNYLFYS